MPAILDDPSSPTIYRVSGEPPYPDPRSPVLPEDIVARQVTLRDRQTVATVVPFASRHQAPASLILYLCDQFNREIEGGDTYPMMDPFEPDAFAAYWFQNFAAVMLLGDLEGPADVVEGKDWARECLGSFYIKPNYPGRSSHVCNAGFLVTEAARNRGVGRLMGEAYIDWAPRLGYSYSVFNLVYETNVASCKIWDALGFKRIGRVKGCGNLKSYPGRLIDAIIYGRDLTPGESEELVSEERFDKIKFYLKYGKYPNGSDRAEKSRLRSAATHYKLLDGEKLMLKDKEVISDPATQFEIARTVHAQHHGGINKTTATIAEKYHWSRIKETVSDVIRNCTECKELGKMPNASASVSRRAVSALADGSNLALVESDAAAAMASSTTSRVFALHDADLLSALPPRSTPSPSCYANLSDISTMPTSSHAFQPQHHALHGHHQEQPRPHAQHTTTHHNPMLQDDPRQHHESPVYQPIDPQMISHPSGADDDSPFGHFDHDATADFQALLSATEEDDQASVDRDLEMLIGHQDDDDGMKDAGGRVRGSDMYDAGFGEPG